MSSFLYKVGKSAYNKPWYFIVGWVAILGVVLSLLLANGIHLSSGIKIEGTESQKVLDQLAKERPEATGGQARIVFTTLKGERLDTPERLSLINKAIQDVYKLDYVINPSELTGKAGSSSAENTQNEAAKTAAAAEALMPDVRLSPDGNVGLFQINFTVPVESLPQSTIDSVLDAIKAAEQHNSGITALPGDSLISVSPISLTEAIGLVVAAIVLFITLGSIVAAGLPLFTAILGVGISLIGAFAFSKFINMDGTTPALALMVGLAVGIDYSLFIVNRQRRMILDQKLSAREAASRAIGTAGSAVFFAGLTVICALCGLLVIGIEFLSTMALVAAASVLVNVLISLTLLPALLGLAGERIVSKKERMKYSSHKNNAGNGIATRWVKGTIKYRWLIIICSIVVLGIAAIPAAKMDLGIPSSATANLKTEARQSYDAISRGFGEGFNGPLLLVSQPKDSSKKISTEMMNNLVADLQKQDNVAQVIPVNINKTGDMAIISLIPKTGPSDKATKKLVQDLRDTDSSIAKTNDMTIGVTGFTAINIDMSSKLAQVFPLYVGIIVILSLIILLLVFRSIIVPIKATIGFLLSILATFGICTAVFQLGWLHSLLGFDTGGPILSFMPIMVTGILYGLAMDYQVFLVSSMRESYVHGYKGRNSVIHGYEQSSRVVIAAAVIMVSVFAGFALSSDISIKQIGFTLAIGIVIDAFIVRMILVSAVMAVFGDKAWNLPKWLDRILPNLDVEGDKLLSKLKENEPNV
ncbi:MULTISPECIES: MMPL family transporter [Paenibacillus]|uniref:RND superfamily putative drug exporter n=1 Tax=Paenibacillus pabuli TaxID=1472 RepID=A0A855XJV0_9BACL|nr:MULTISPECIES: MMPL family transporter [Paenibacillus]PWW32704.1 RND superfamily putative drug exporter [Paenibacillus pabuli]PXV98347.1 RND superfamily putative drug exporter [Paenibacillus taichungensis]